MLKFGFPQLDKEDYNLSYILLAGGWTVSMLGPKGTGFGQPVSAAFLLGHHCRDLYLDHDQSLLIRE